METGLSLIQKIREIKAIIGQKQVINSLVLNTGATHLFTQGSGRLLGACSYQSPAQLMQFTNQQVAAELQEAVFSEFRNIKLFQKEKNLPNHE